MIQINGSAARTGASRAAGTCPDKRIKSAGADAWSATNVAHGRSELAKLLGANPAEIAFTKNTTEGLLIAAHAFDLKAGDNIVLTDMEHVNNVWVWRHWESQGVEIRFAAHRNGRLTIDTFLEKMDARTRVVACAYVTYGNGYRIDLPGLGKICREHGAAVMLVTHDMEIGRAHV